MTMVAASVAFGNSARNGVSASVATAMPMAVNAPAAGVAAPGVEIDHRACEPARHRIAAAKPGRDIGRAQPDQFLIGIDALAPFGCQRLGHRNRFHKTHDRYDESRHQQRADHLDTEIGRAEQRQPLGHRANQRHALVAEIKRRRLRRWSEARPAPGPRAPAPSRGSPARRSRQQHGLEPSASRPAWPVRRLRPRAS